jgi:hypothetical protein
MELVEDPTLANGIEKAVLQRRSMQLTSAASGKPDFPECGLKAFAFS